MKYFAYNDKLFAPNEAGSFTTLSRNLNKAFKKLNILAENENTADIVIYPECLDVGRRWKNQIPLLACEYSKPLSFVAEQLKQYPLVLGISKFAQNNLINGGLDPEKVKYVYLGSEPEIWYPTGEKKFDKFTYLCVNNSNERGALLETIEAFKIFSQDKKDVQLIIKDGYNKYFKIGIEYKQPKNIKYIHGILSEEGLRYYYNASHFHIYPCHTTSFGFNILDSCLANSCSLSTWGSAPAEFVPSWSQPFKLKSYKEVLTKEQLGKWRMEGLHTTPDHFLDMMGDNVISERVTSEDILKLLAYSYKNYGQYLDILPKYQQYIKENLSWDLTAKNIIKEVEKVYGS